MLNTINSIILLCQMYSATLSEPSLSQRPHPDVQAGSKQQWLELQGSPECLPPFLKPGMNETEWDEFCQFNRKKHNKKEPLSE